MPSLLERLTADLKDAMRAGDAMRRDEIRSLMAMLKAAQQTKLTRSLEQQGLIVDDDAELSAEQLAEIERLRAASSLNPDEEQRVLVRSVVQHRQSIDAFTKGKRDDLLHVEEAQLAIDATYVPQLAEADIEQAIQAAISESGAQVLRDQGKVMTLLSARLRGRADMKAVSARVQALLTK